MSEDEEGVPEPFDNEDGGADDDDRHGEYGEPVEGEENPFYQRKKTNLFARKPKATVTAAAAAASGSNRDQLVPFQQPIQDPNTMSVSYQVTDAVAYYGNVALWALFYGRGTKGIMSPVLYDTKKGGL